MSIASLAKLGLQYGKTGLKYASVVPHYAFGDGYTKIQNARKAVGGYTIFHNPIAKGKVGFKTLKADLVATANAPGIMSKAASAWKTGVTSAQASSLAKLSKLQTLKAGAKGITSAIGKSISSTWKSGAAAASTGKYLGKLGKFGKALGGAGAILKPLTKMPVIASLVTLGYETYTNIYPAFKNEGLWAGIKETGKSCVKIAAGAALGAVGAACGGAIGGIAGYVAGEWLADKIMGPSYAETHAAETQGQDQLSEAQQNGVMPEETNTQALRDQLRQEEAQASEQAEQSEQSEQADQTQQTETQNESGLPATLQASDTSYQPQQTLTSNPYTQGYTPYTNPFGFDAGSNIFQRFPMGYQFQYQGNGMGMMM